MRVVLALAAVSLVAACSGSSPQASTPLRPMRRAGSAPGAGGASSGSGGGASSASVGGSSVAGAAAKVKDWCVLLPNDIIAVFAPGAPPAAAGTYPNECGASNGTGALDFSYTTGFGTSLPAGAPGGEVVPGLAQFAYIDRPTKDEVELWVTLSADSGYGLFIDVAGHDGKDHKADAIAIAQAVLGKLQ